LFKKDGEFIINEKDGRALDVQGGVDAENRNIIVNRNNGKTNQRWQIIYVDEYPDEPTKGQLNKNFGLYVERDFYVVS
jgi:formylmethanofuran dehydrogenase subunit E-like metal-binding protein